MDMQKKKSLLFGWTAILLLIIGMGSNYYFATHSVLLRTAGLLALAALAVFLSAKTINGQRFLSYWQESLAELRKVVWPTKKETMQSTIGVLAMVLIMGVFLWSVDAILVRMVAWLLRANGV